MMIVKLGLVYRSVLVFIGFTFTLFQRGIEEYTFTFIIAPHLKFDALH